MAKRSFKKFEARLKEIGLQKEIRQHALAHHVTLKELYSGFDRSPSIVTARRAVYGWLAKEGKGVREIARLFDRAPYGISKMLQDRP